MFAELSTLSRAQSWPLFVAVFLTYLVIVRLHRYDRARSFEKGFAPHGKASYRNLTNNQAQAILKDLTELEFPKFFGFSIIFALFKVSTKRGELCCEVANKSLCYRLMACRVYRHCLWLLASSRV